MLDPVCVDPYRILDGEPSDWAVAVHGGAGDRAVSDEMLAACRLSAERGARVLADGGSAVDAVEQAVRALEDDPRFNAGTGAVLNAEGAIELDAAIMEGPSLRFGAVAALPPFRNPVAIARAVFEVGDHAFYAGEGAARFARAMGFEACSEQELLTDRTRSLWVARGAERGPLGASRRGRGETGTVGAVARDALGRSAAATSTGGTWGKRAGRVGDTPLPGSGTYADALGAASATGAGEFILRACLGKRAVDALGVGEGPVRAVAQALAFLDEHLSSSAGLILVGADGRIGIGRSTATMPWAACRKGAATTAGR